MRVFLTGAILTLIVVIGAMVYGRSSQAQNPELAGTWTVSAQDGGQPTMVWMLNADGTAMSTGASDLVYLGAWETTDKGHLAFTLVTLADRGGPQGMTIDAPVAEQADGSLFVGTEYRLKRITP